MAACAVPAAWLPSKAPTLTTAPALLPAPPASPACPSAPPAAPKCEALSPLIVAEPAPLESALRGLATATVAQPAALSEEGTAEFESAAGVCSTGWGEGKRIAL